jgi:RND family efflux transporter MFP subunit
MKHESARRALAWTAPVLLALVLGACGQSDGGPAAAEKVAPLELAPADVVRAAKAQASGGLPVSGTLQPLVQTTVQSRVAAEVGAVLVREGERVAPGQVLARLSTQDLDARVKQAEAQLAAARVEADLKRALAERNRKLFEKKYFSEVDLNRSIGEAEANEENVRSQQALLNIARKALNDASVKAPQGGIVARRYIEPGSSVGMDSRLFDIVDLAIMELEVPVPASDIAAVKAGQHVVFTVSGFGERKFEGKVVRINPVADAGTRAIAVYVRVANPGQELKGGMYASGEIAVGAGGEGMAVPLEALHADAGQAPWVLVLNKDKLEKRVVEVAARDERRNRAFLRSGVNDGDIVVVAQLTENAINQPARLSE